MTRDRRMNLSGLERDRFYLSARGLAFSELSYLSGLDGIEDARASAIADLDRDGHEDLVVVNRNSPLLRVYHNRVGPRGQRRFLGLRLIGAATATGAGGGRRASNRDAVGARVIVRCGGQAVRRDVVMGAGFGGANSPSLTVGLDRCQRADEIAVRFPSGEEQVFRGVAVDRFYTVVEQEGMREWPDLYSDRSRAPAPAPMAPVEREGRALLGALGGAGSGSSSPLVLVSFWASWCEACERDQPRLERLAEIYRGRVDVVAASLEPKDTPAVAQQIRAERRPAYPMQAFRPATAAAAERIFGFEPPMPSTVMLERSTGRIVLRTSGTPSRSELERLLDARAGR